MTTLGPFELSEPMGRGGMGLVWRATGPDGDEVAIKVLRHDVPEGTARVMQREVACMASLCHPHVVAVHEVGTVSAEAAASDDRLPEGSPWVAMELAENGSVLERYRTLRSRQVHALLRQVLLALADAHAHGLIHRDLKPSNILLGPDHRAQLVDFGLVLKTDDVDPDAPQGGGTPSYMAPEQVDPTLGPMGPWTDLYSLGIVAWVLTTGRRPFEASDPSTQMLHHVRTPLPLYQPKRAVPAGFAHWLGRMLSKAPAMRFQRAADALNALDALGPPDDRSPLARSTQPPMPDAPRQLPTRPPEPVVPLGRQLLPSLRLLGLREPALVGRRALQERLWTALCRVHAQPRPRVVLLRGPSGVGKTRLCTWLSRTAHRIGAAQVLVVRPETTFASLVQHTLAPGTRSWRPVSQWARDRGLPDHEVRLLEHLASGANLPLADAYTGLLLFLRGLAEQRPVVLHIDDLHLSGIGLGLAQRLAELSEALPVLALVTTPDDALARDDALDLAWEDLAASEDAEELVVPPLQRADGIQLLRSVVQLSPGLESDLVARTAGNPLFALEVVRTWAQSGRLHPSGGGLELVGPPGALPATVTDAARDRLERFLADRDDWSEALERAALLGMVVDAGEWQRTCDGVPGDLMPALLVSRLALPNPEYRGLQWSFAHGMLREALRQRAHISGRLRLHHRAIAATLHADGAPPERLAPHLQGAGDHLGAGQAWLEVARQRLDDLRVGEALRAASHADDQLSLAGVPADHELRLTAKVLLGKSEHVEGRTEQGQRHLEEVAEIAPAHSAVYRDALLGLGSTAGWRGDHDGFRHWLELAHQRSVEAGDADRAGRAKERLARFESMAGHHARAVALTAEVLASGWDEGMARRTAVIAHGRAGDLDAARTHARAGAEQLAKAGRLGSRASLWNDLASVLLQGGDPDGADEALVHAEADARRAGSTHTLAYVLANGGLLAARRGDHEQAATRLEEAIVLSRDPRLRSLLSAVSLLPLAQLRRWRAFDRACQGARGLQGTLGEDDAPELVGRAVRLAREAGEEARAEAAEEVRTRLLQRGATATD